MTTRIKICGLTRPLDAALAAQLGADYLGLVFARSLRRVHVEEVRGWVGEVRAQWPRARWVGVFVAPSSSEVEEACEALSLDLVQIHRGAPPAGSRARKWILALPADRVEEALRFYEGGRPAPSPDSAGAPAPWAVLADHPGAGAGGTGLSFDYGILRDWRSWSAGRRLFLAGGLDPDNVGEAVRRVRPFAVDASSRLEESPGCKDPKKVAAFISAVRREEES